METSTKLGRVSLVPRGAYDPAAEYVRLDVARYGGSAWLALRTVRGVAPEDGADWMLLAQRGDVGATGPKGKTGDKGDKGDVGDKGDTGDTGATGNGVASIQRTAGNGAAGTTDTYTVTMTDGSSYDFHVYNGADGDGAGDMRADVYDPEGRHEDVYGYADGLLPVIHDLELPAEGWEGAEAPFVQSVSVPGVLADPEAQIIQIQPADRAVWAECGLECTGQGAGTLAFSAREKPGEAVALLVSVQAARKGGAAV